jgi:hypothetical protein
MFRRKGKKNLKEFFSYLEVWLQLFFKVFFIYKCIKNNIFDISALK